MFYPNEEPNEVDAYEIEYYLRSAAKGKHDVNGKYLVYYGYSAPTLFYVNMLNDKGVDFKFKDMQQIKTNDIVIACEDTVRRYIHERFYYKEKHISQSIFTYTITGDPCAEMFK